MQWVCSQKNPYKVHKPNLVLVWNGHLYLIGSWLGEELATNTKKKCIQKRFDCMFNIRKNPLNRLKFNNEQN